MTTARGNQRYQLALLATLWGLANRSHLYSSKIRLLASARAIVPRLAGHVLDVGAGSQPYRKYLPAGSSYVSMDISDSTGADIVGTVLKIPQEDGTFDGVICTEVIEHVADPKGAIREIGRVTKPGAKVYLTAPMSWGLHYEPYDFFRYTKYGLTSMLEEEGFRIVETRQIGGTFVMSWARVSDTLVTLLYRAGFPLKYLLGSANRVSLLSLIVFPLVAVVDAVAAVADFAIPGARKDALGWAVLAEKTDGQTDR